MGRFFVAVRKVEGRLCDIQAPEAVTFMQPGTLIYAILAPGIAKIGK
jgi:hypothetical protein